MEQNHDHRGRIVIVLPYLIRSIRAIMILVVVSIVPKFSLTVFMNSPGSPVHYFVRSGLSGRFYRNQALRAVVTPSSVSCKVFRYAWRKSVEDFAENRTKFYFPRRFLQLVSQRERLKRERFQSSQGRFQSSHRAV